jgi:hypothetical protein
LSFSRKNLFPISILAITALLTLLVAEGAHHHGALEDNDGCSVCSWQMTGSQAPSTPLAPVLLPTILFFCVLYFFIPTFVSFNFISPTGRGPPQNLL